MNALFESNLTSLPLINRGKVRDIYDLDADHLLIVTTDRISAFDVILPTPIPGKGRILSETAQFWFKQTQNIIPNHIAHNLSLADYLTPDELAQLDEWLDRGDVSLQELVSHVLVHELAHHFGWSDADIARIDPWWE